MGAARVLQPRHRRAGRHGRDDHARRGPGGRRRRRRGAAVLGAALARRPRPLHAPRRRRPGRGASTRSPSCSPASRASRSPRATRWSCCRRSTPCTGAPTTGPKILADEQIRYAAGLPEDQARQFTYEPLGVVGVIAPVELPLVDPLRRGRDRADGRQRRRAQAGQPDAAARRADPGGRSRRPASPRAWSAPSTAAARSARRCASPRRAKIFFTGSVEVGRKVGEICAAAA